MLVSDENVYGEQWFQDIYGKAIELKTGVYETESLNPPGSMMERFTRGHGMMFQNKTNYGVCDNYKQILKKYPELKDKERKFIIMLTPIRKEEDKPQGGWR